MFSVTIAANGQHLPGHIRTFPWQWHVDGSLLGSTAGLTCEAGSEARPSDRRKRSKMPAPLRELPPAGTEGALPLAIR